VALAEWMNRRQQEAIEYLPTENRILREKLGHKRLVMSESQKACISPDTDLRERSAVAA
jgi:hypothetical protein